MVDRVTGNKDDRESDKSEDEVHLESQLAAAAAEQERRKQEKEASRRDQQQQQTETGGGSSIRDKYLSKLNKLKAKTQNEKASAAAGSVGGAAITEASVATSKGLSTWVVNDGTNELLVRDVVVPKTESICFGMLILVAVALCRATLTFVVCSRPCCLPARHCNMYDAPARVVTIRGCS